MSLVVVATALPFRSGVIPFSAVMGRWPVIANLLAGGELLIPTLVLLFGVDIKLAGSLSLAISLPTMLTAFARYSRDKSFVVLGQHPRFVLVMAVGSIVGTFMGGRLLGVVPDVILVPLLSLLLLLSSVKIWRHT